MYYFTSLVVVCRVTTTRYFIKATFSHLQSGICSVSDLNICLNLNYRIVLSVIISTKLKVAQHSYIYLATKIFQLCGILT